MYTDKVPAVVQVGAMAADDLTAAAVHGSSLAVLSQIKVTRLCAVVTTTLVADTTVPVVTYKRRPTFGSAGGEVSMGTLTFPDGTAAGKVLYKDIDPVVCYPGDEIAFEVTTAAADSGAEAGGAVYGVEYESLDEYVGNQADMVASA